MPPKRLNVLIYAGPGATPNSIRHATWTLRRLLGPNYAIINITAEQLLKEPWPPTCALLVMPGGADMGYCRSLNGEGNRRIKQYVQLGGSYLGLCAGGYFGCQRCEFEVGKRAMEVVGDRELGFFPGTCRGLAFPGFVYNSEAGARAVTLRVDADGLGKDAKTFTSYYNGGGVFADAGKYRDKGVQVLATFGDDLAVDGGEGGAAVVFCKIGEGKVVLTGPHPEFAPQNLNPDNYTKSENATLIDDLKADETPRNDFLKACLDRLGLEVSKESTPVPSLSRLHLSSAQPTQVAELLHALHEAGMVTKEKTDEYIKGENDLFHLEHAGRWNMSSVTNAVTDVLPKPVQDSLPSSVVSSSSANVDTNKENAKPQADPLSSDRILDYNEITKHIVTHENEMPDGKETPSFNHAAFFANLKSYVPKNCRESDGMWGQTLLYGEVVTSTNTLLERNPTLLSHLPIGFTATATTQVAGRGRGSNVWVSPPGSLMFSTVLRHGLALSNTAPVVFIQYIAALAIIAGIHGYAKGYESIPVKLKWPNDIYALDPSKDPKDKSYVKIGGILVNSSYAGGDYTIVTGIGMNVNNTAPSVSLSQLAQKAGLAPFTLEKLLASILTHFEELYTRFCRAGFDARFESIYYDSWLHSDQIVTLEAEGGAKARIKGITRDWGLLVAEELNMDGKSTGRKWELQSDSNSFDFFKGLLKKKT
ncbi:biotin holocarboxylase synthetase [Vermiconidia calcicola]|uniref:Biotin holocarboxylase synthetase n=1 Tax=Vermiconidia calcicola TaxID=1690605 RepID=A0ACC3ME96_9PEZI|nr:biotin holocarboxylase synthetase [Vermiconidia calcicola]